MKSMRHKIKDGKYFYLQQNEAKIDQSKGVEITAVNIPKNVERQIDINIARKSKKKS